MDFKKTDYEIIMEVAKELKYKHLMKTFKKSLLILRKVTSTLTKINFKLESRFANEVKDDFDIKYSNYSESFKIAKRKIKKL